MPVAGRLKNLLKRRRELHPDFPTRINVEPTSACNMNCNICPRHKTTKKVGHMDFELFCRIIDQIAPHPQAEIRFHKDGEPLLHSRILDMIAYARGKAPRNTLDMATNGLLLSGDKARGLIEAGLDVLLVSINAAKAETYRIIRNSDEFERVRQNVIDFVELKKQMNASKPLVKLQLVVTDETRGEIDQFKSMWAPYDVHPVLAPYINWGGEVSDAAPLPDFRHRYPCNFLWNVFSIDWDGEATFCNVDYSKLGVVGRLTDETIKEIWKGEKMEHYRRLHLEDQFAEPPLCGRCNYWSFNPNVWVRIGNRWR